MNIQEINQHLGNIDIYLLDQILKGRYSSDMKVLDAGCGEGRNLMYFMNNNFDVSGVDINSEAIRMVKFIIGANYAHLAKGNFHVCGVDAMPFDNQHFDLIISSAVLHFSESEKHFRSMFAEMIRVLKPGGQLFLRMTSDIGLDISTFETKGDLFIIGDDTLRFLITRALLHDITKKYDLELIEPIKSTNVNDQRSMGTFVFQKKLEH